MPNYDILLFDADGTLFDFDAAEAFALRTGFVRAGLAFEEEMLPVYHNLNLQLWRALERGEIDKPSLQPERFRLLFERYHIDYDPIAFNQVFVRALTEGGQLNDGALELCRNLTEQGFQLYIITNGIAATQKGRLGASSLRPYILDMFISEEIGCVKPAKAYFDHVAAAVPIKDKSRALVIGDSLTADIAGGNAAGLDTCWFNPGRAENDTPASPTYEIAEWSELYDILG